MFMFNIFQERKASKFEDLFLQPENIQYPMGLWAMHPSSRLSIDYRIYNPTTFQSNINTFNIYTDGLVCITTVGAALAKIKSNGGILKTGTYSLNNHNTICEAEAAAILKAIEYLIIIHTTRDCNIFTDSLSILQALNNPVNLNKIINTIKNKFTILNT